MNDHLEHHLFMTVPHYNLPKAHRMLREAGVLERAEVVLCHGAGIEMLPHFQGDCSVGIEV